MKTAYNINNLNEKINHQNPFWIALGIYIFMLAISFIIFNYRRPLACDMSEYLNNALRIINGDLPYIDFWLLFPPGEVYFPALIYKIFGVNTDLLRIITVLSSCLVPVAGFYLGRLLFQDNIKSIISAFIFYFFSVVYNYEGPDYINLFLLFTILGAYYLIKYIKYSERNKFIFLSGLMFAFAFFFKLYEVGGVYAGFLLILVIYSITTKRSFKEIIKIVAFFVIPLIGLIALLFISFGDLSLKVINDIAFESVKNGTSMNLPYFNDLYYVKVSILKDWDLITNKGNIFSLVFLVYHSFTFIVVSGFYLVPFIAIASFLFYLKTKPVRKELIIATLIFIWALLSFPKGLGRSDLAHLAPSLAPFMLFLFFLGIYAKYKLQRKSAIVIVSIMFLSVLFPFFKAASLIRKPPIYVQTANGYIPFKDKNNRRNFEKTINYILSHTAKDDYIFVTPWDAPPIYALSERRNPTYYDSLNDLMIRKDEDKQRKIIADIIQHKTKLIIHNADWGYDNKPEQQFRVACNLLQKFIDTQCEQVAHFGFYRIYRLRNN